jgi:hypothetical protein
MAGNDGFEETVSVVPSLNAGEVSLVVHSRSRQEDYENIIRVLRLGMDDIVSDDVREIERTTGYISGLHSTCDVVSIPLITWTVDEGYGGDVHISTLCETGPAGNWTEPLPLDSDASTQIDPVLLSTGKGSFLATFIEIDGSGENLSIVRTLEEIDLSNAGSIIDSGYELLGDYKKWESVNIYVKVRNDGLSDDGRIYVNLDRESRDPTSGEIARISVASKLVQFSGPGQVIEVEFTTTLVEHQLRYSVWTAAGWGDPPALISEDHVDLPVTADPRIDTLSASHPVDGEMVSKVTLEVRNSGLVAVDPLIIEVLADVGSELDDITGSGLEPAGIRKVEDARSLNRTSDGLGSQTVERYVMNITLEPGRNVIWAALTMPDGRRSIRGPIFVDLFPKLSLVQGEALILLEKDSPLSLGFELMNNGPVDKFPGGNDTGLNLSVTIKEKEGSTILGPFLLNSSIPSPGNISTVPFSTSLKDLEPGYYKITLSVSDMSGIPGSRSGDTNQEMDLLILEKANISITGRVEGDLGFRGREFLMNISNPSNRTIGICRVVLFNGYPNDGVVVSEGFILDVEPNGTGYVSLPFDLDTGLYFLSISASTSSYVDTNVPWKETVMNNISFEHVIEDSPSGIGENEEVDMGDVNDTILIGASTIFSVLLISALFRRKEDNDDDKE